MGAFEEREATASGSFLLPSRLGFGGEPMKGVILAAGDGTRLAPLTCQCPKVLLKVGERAIIDFTLDAFASVGITDLAIVVGYRGDAVVEWVGDGSDRGLRIHYLFNPDYKRGNALSLYATRTFVVDEVFLLSMADHMVSADLLSRLLAGDELNNALAVDFAPALRHIQEATKVLVSPEGLVMGIGKGLSQWNGVDAGVFLLTPAIFDAVGELIKEDKAEYELSQAIARLIERGDPLRACDVSGCFWHDIDTLEDLKLATQMVAGGRDWENPLRG